MQGQRILGRAFVSSLEAHYSARAIEERILAAIRGAGLDPGQRVSFEALGALDHFHTGGLRASRELLELAQIRPRNAFSISEPDWAAPPGCSLPRSAVTSTASNCPPTTVPVQPC